MLEVEDQIGTIRNSVRRARALEVIVGGERKTKEHVISSIEDQPSVSKTGGSKTSSDENMDERVRTVLERLKLEEEELGVSALAGNDLRRKLQRGGNLRQGRNTSRPRGGGGFRSGSGKPTSGVAICWYCNIPGHMQATCRKREKEGGVWVNKPLEVCSIEEDEGGSQHVTRVSEQNALEETQDEEYLN